MSPKNDPSGAMTQPSLGFFKEYALFTLRRLRYSHLPPHRRPEGIKVHQLLPPDCLVLMTIPKSGTNYLRLFLANYLMLYYFGIETNVTYNEMHTEIFPNDWNNTVNGKGERLPPHPVMAKTPYSDFIYGHIAENMIQPPRKLIALYRNPLDTLISQYFYSYHYRPERQGEYSHPRELIDDWTDGFARVYLNIRCWAAHGSCLPVSYEGIFRFPEASFLSLLDWLALPKGLAKVRTAIEFSSIKKVRQEEEQTGPIHSPQNFTGSFVRSGQIGQWKEWLTEDDAGKIAARLESHDISLNEFIIE